MYSRVLFVALGLVAAVGTAVVYLIGGNLAISGALSVGTVAAFVLYVGQIYQPLAQLTNARVEVLTALVSFERVFEVLDFPPAIADRAGADELRRATGRVDFDHVWFRHPAGAQVSLVSLEAPRHAGRRPNRASGSSRTCRSRWSRARRSRSSDRPARARRRSRCSCPA